MIEPWKIKRIDKKNSLIFGQLGGFMKRFSRPGKLLHNYMENQLLLFNIVKNG